MRGQGSAWKGRGSRGGGDNDGPSKQICLWWANARLKQQHNGGFHTNKERSFLVLCRLYRLQYSAPGQGGTEHRWRWMQTGHTQASAEDHTTKNPLSFRTALVHFVLSKKFNRMSVRTVFSTLHNHHSSECCCLFDQLFFFRAFLVFYPRTLFYSPLFTFIFKHFKHHPLFPGT